MGEHIILKIVVRLLLPFIIMYALYIDFHGEISPGGGFQSGIILAAGFIVYSFSYDLAALQKIIPLNLVKCLSILGVLIYSALGIIPMIMGGKFLEYSVLLPDKIHGQEFGVMMVEAGIGITVFSSIMIIFYSFGERSGDA